jgi:C4-dicarboxylate-binding protein DctP
MKDASKLANDIAKKENDDALEAIRKSGKSQVLALTPAERAEWKKAMVKTHREMEAKIGPELVHAFYKETGFDPAK